MFTSRLTSSEMLFKLVTLFFFETFYLILPLQYHNAKCSRQLVKFMTCRAEFVGSVSLRQLLCRDLKQVLITIA